VLRLLEARSWPIDLKHLIQKAVEIQPIQSEGTTSKLFDFMRQRFAAILEERGFKFDEMDAVLEKGIEVTDAIARLKALHEVRQKAEFEPLAVAFKRGMNIVRQANKGSSTHPADSDGDVAIETGLLQESVERQLFEILEKVRGEVTKFTNQRAYHEALASMVPLREPLDAFFNGVMVMAEDEKLRTNRLQMMRRLVQTFSKIADFSKLQNA